MLWRNCASKAGVSLVFLLTGFFCSWIKLHVSKLKQKKKTTQKPFLLLFNPFLVNSKTRNNSDFYLLTCWRKSELNFIELKRTNKKNILAWNVPVAFLLYLKIIKLIFILVKTVRILSISVSKCLIIVNVKRKNINTV